MPDSFSHESGIIFFVSAVRLSGLAVRLHILLAGMCRRAFGLKNLCLVMPEYMPGRN